LAGAVAHTHNPSYLGDRDSRITVWSQSRQKVSKTVSQRTS
jgi:hypothetical protein